MAPKRGTTPVARSSGGRGRGRGRGDSDPSLASPAPHSPQPSQSVDEAGPSNSKKRAASEESTKKTSTKRVKKAQGGKVKKVPAADLIKKLEQLGKEASAADGQSKENMPSDSTLYSDWREVIAQALVREPSCIVVMQNPPPNTDYIRINRSWLASLHLDFRYARFPTFIAWARGWFWVDMNKTAVLIRARELFVDVAGADRHGTRGTKIGPPPQGAAADALRESIFELQSTRHKILVVIKAATDMEATLAKRLVAIRKGEQKEMDRLVSVIMAMDAMKSELRTKLRSSKVLKAGYDILDKLIDRLDQPDLRLWQLPTEVEAIDEESTEIEAIDEEPTEPADINREPSLAPATNTTTTAMDPATLRNLIDQQHPFALRFYDGWDDLERADRVDPVTITAPRSGNIAQSRAGYASPVVDEGKLYELDDAVANALKATLLTLDHHRFTRNMQRFENVIARPEVAVKQPNSTNAFETQATQDFHIDDNLFHVRSYIVRMLRAGFFIEEKDEIDKEKLQRTLRRMWAVVSLLYGCEKEGSLWLIVMDALLEDLALQVIGHLDSRLPDTGDHIIRNILAQTGETSWLPNSVNAEAATAKDDVLRLEREDRAREHFVELAIMYRGAVLMAYISASEGARDQHKWFTGLVTWCNRCACDTCCELLQVAHNPNHAMAKHSLNIGVKDMRLGFPDQRSLVSHNRVWAYPCLSRFSRSNRWHDGFGPFFFYFAHIYHLGCKPFRGKPVFVRMMKDNTARVTNEAMVAAGLVEAPAADADHPGEAPASEE